MKTTFTLSTTNHFERLACASAPQNLAVVGALALLAAPAYAQTWQTVDNYQYQGQGAGANALAVSPRGTIFAAGTGDGTDGLVHGLITASADDGNTWSAPLDDFTYGGGYNAYYNAIASDPFDNVYGAGWCWNNTAYVPNHWFVRRGTDPGTTWATVDDFQDGGIYENSPMANGVAADQAGNVYVAGSSAVYGWIVRKGIGGLNFATVDSLAGSSANAVFVHPTAGVFVAGGGVLGTSTTKSGTVSNISGWLVRRSTNAGATWSSVDGFTLSNGAKQAMAFGIGADALGNIYVVGFADSVSGKAVYSHWIVRKSADGGNTWTTVDNALSEPRPSGYGPAAVAAAFGADTRGNLYVAGRDYGSSGALHWIVRESPGTTGSWQTVDDVPNANANAVATDALGNVFVGGGNNNWLVRKR
jgi:hypothetical protein